MKSVVLLGALALGTQDRESVLRVSWGAPVNLDPHRAATLAESRYVSALFEGLTAMGADGVGPGAAGRWDASADGLAWTFILREAAWSDGAPVVAQDFVGAWRRALRPDTGCPFAPLFRVFRNAGPWMEAAEADLLLTKDDPGEGRLAQAARKRHVAALKRRGYAKAAEAAEARPDVEEKDLGFEAVDARTLRVRLERRTPWLPELLSFMCFAPIPERTIAKHGAAWVRAGNIVTNGAFLLETATPVDLTLRRREKAVAGFPERVLVEFHSPEVALRKFREGRLDWVAGELLPSPRPAEAQAYAAWGTLLLRFNAAKPPFDKPEARRAFAHAVDRSAAEKESGLVAAATLVPPGFRGYAEVRGPAADAKAAMEALLRATDFDPSKFPKVEILTTDAFGLRGTERTLADRLEKTLGIRVGLRTLKWPAYVEALRTGEFQAAVGAWMGDTFDPAAFLEPWVGGHPENAGRWSNAEFDGLLKAAAGEARLATLEKAEELLLGEAAAVPLLRAGDAFLASPRVAGLLPDPMGRVPLHLVRLGK